MSRILGKTVQVPILPNKIFQILHLGIVVDICKILLQICAFFRNLWKLDPTKIIPIFVSLI
jgi:hypothetical protein